MSTFVYNDEQLIDVGNEIPIKLVKVKEKAMKTSKSRRTDDTAAMVGSGVTEKTENG